VQIKDPDAQANPIKFLRLPFSLPIITRQGSDYLSRFLLEKQGLEPLLR
jgi:hypothetical protein